MRIGSLFSGIGGLDLGLERSGLGTVVWQCEADDFCRRVLARHWPGVPCFKDVKDVGKTASSVDLICGGFPCQPVSVAGSRKAQDDERWLWPEYARVVRELEPAIVIVENVPGLRSAGLHLVLSDLAGLGFNAEWATITAAQVGAPHLRARVFLVATHTERVVVRDEPGWLERSLRAAVAPIPGDVAKGGDAVGGSGSREASSYYYYQRRLESALSLAEKRGWSEHCGWSIHPFTRVDDGVTKELVRRRRALGNAVVVQCAQAVGEAVKKAVFLRAAAQVFTRIDGHTKDRY